MTNDLVSYLPHVNACLNGLLAEEGNDFYSLTEKGKQAAKG
jgi:hypothetical protein